MDFLQANFWFSTDKFLVDYENGGTPKWFEIWGTPKRLDTPTYFKIYLSPEKNKKSEFQVPPNIFFGGGVQAMNLSIKDIKTQN